MSFYNLGFLASRAAISIELLARNCEDNGDYQNIAQLSDTIIELSKQEDFITRTLFSEFFWPKQRTIEQRMSGEANVHANLFAKDLLRLREFSSEDQTDFAEYCIRLSYLSLKYSRV